MSGEREESQRLVSELRSAALQAQTAAGTRAIESCVSALDPGTAEITAI